MVDDLKKTMAEQYRKSTCPSFGRDPKNGDPGIEMSTKECQYCEDQDPVMHAACAAECEAEWVPPVDAEGTDDAVVEATEVEDVTIVSETETNGPADEPVAKTKEQGEVPMAKNKKKNGTKAETPVVKAKPKAEKKDRPKGKAMLAAEAILAGKTKRVDILAHVVENGGGSPKAAASIVSICLRFGTLLGALTKDNGEYLNNAGYDKAPEA